MMRSFAKVFIPLVITALLASAVFAAKYPSSNKTAPDGSTLLTGELIGEERGWDGTSGTGCASAFDGDKTTYYDPTERGSENCYCGRELDGRYVLTQVCILPRDGQSSRYYGAEIQGSNDGENWYSMFVSDRESDGQTWHVITRFENNIGFKYYRYINYESHGDVAEVEFYGYAGILGEDPYDSSTPPDMNALTVYFDSGTTQSFDPVTVAFGGTYPEIGGIPEKDGCIFGGWYYSPEGGERVEAGDTVTKLSSHTLYAHWLTSADITASEAAVENAENADSAVESAHTAPSPVPAICIAVSIAAVICSAAVIIIRRKKA